MENFSKSSAEETNDPEQDGCSADEQISEDLSLIAGAIVTNAMHIPRSLFCPFCADEYMFEFTLKDHLKRKHSDELSKINFFQGLENLQECKSYLCPYCRAVFYYSGLLPKHIASFHGYNILNHWFQSNRDCQQIEPNSEPSILYAACSPGLTEIFANLATKENLSTQNNSPQLKSILKKTPKKCCSITQSPSAVSIRRNKGEIVKRSLSVRRELRFDLPPLQKTPEEKAVKHHRKFLNVRKLMRIRKIFSRKKTKNVQSPNIVTSTPNNILDDSNTKVRNKSMTKPVPRPLFFNSERYQCAYCMEMYSSNTDLVGHFKEHHKGGRKIVFPGYRCGQCGTKFFKNSYLVRHCQVVHTPQKT